MAHPRRWVKSHLWCIAPLGGSCQTEWHHSGDYPVLDILFQWLWHSKIRDHFCFPDVPAARLKVSACKGNLSGASASHNTAIAAQQHGVMPASQQLPMVSLHSSWKTAALPVDNPNGCLVLSWRSWLNPATWSPGTSCTYGWTMAPSICGGMNFVSPLKAMGLRINLRLNALASSLLRSPPGVCLWSPHHTTRPLRGTIQYAWRRHAPQRFLWLPPWPSRLGPSPISQQSWQQQHGFSQPQRLHWWDNPFVLPRWTEPKL